jgi:hypothetical protein
VLMTLLNMVRSGWTKAVKAPGKVVPGYCLEVLQFSAFDLSFNLLDSSY